MKNIKSLLSIANILLPGFLLAQLSIGSLGTDYSINFDQTVTGVVNGQINGSGFAPSPSSGQIDSDGLIVIGLSDGDLAFGDTGTSGDYARGASTGGVTTGGIYAFETSTGDYALGVQPGASDFTSGQLILKINNATGGNISQLNVAFELKIYNDQERASRIRFKMSHDISTSSNEVLYSDLDRYTTEASGAPSWETVNISKSLHLSSTIENGEDFYLIWESDDFSGSGNRDEIALDDIVLSAEDPGINVRINEIVTDSQTDWSTNGFDGTDGGGAISDVDNFIEFFIGSANIDLTNWTLEIADDDETLSGLLSSTDLFDESKYFTGSTGSFTETEVNDFFVLGNPSANFSGSDLEDVIYVSLVDPSGVVIDEVEIGDDPELDGNADAAPEGISTGGQSSGISDEAVRRIYDGFDTDVDVNDFIQGAVTLGSSNNSSNVAGSGYAINFVGTSSQYIEMPDDDTMDFGTGDFSITMWFKMETSGTEQVLYSNCGGALGVDGMTISINSSDLATVTLPAAALGNLTGTTTLQTDEWYHLALVKNGLTMFLYINGVEEINSLFVSFNISSNSNPRLGSRTCNTSDYFTGEIDEFLVLSNALTESTIQDWLCRSAVSPHPNFGDLIHYYNFDEGSGSTLSDIGGSTDGTFNAAPTWVLSGAPIGDLAVSNFGSPLSDGTEITLNSENRGRMTGTLQTADNATGFVIYQVIDPPNNGTVPGGMYDLDDNYWGVKVFGSDGSHSYDISYDYSDHDRAQDNNTPTLASRSDNSNGSFTEVVTNITLDTNSKTITVTGLTGTEFILGGSSEALPVELMYFGVENHSSGQLLAWATASEINNDRFEIEKSVDGSNFNKIGSIKGAGTTSEIIEYTFLDQNRYTDIIYYRLKQIDFDAAYEYSQIITGGLSLSRHQELVLFPNPSDGIITLVVNDLAEEIQVEIFEIDGLKAFSKKFKNQGKLEMDLSSLSAGQYILSIHYMNQNEQARLIIK